jgi:hypothetical protein
MIKIVLQCLTALELIVKWIRERRLSILKANIRQESIEALAVAKETKDTSRLDAIFNNKSL